MYWHAPRHEDDPERLRRELRDREYELEEMRERVNREREREQEEREERRREMRERMQEAEREASTWEEAFSKNRRRYQRELAEESAMREEMLAKPEPEWQAYAPDLTFWQECLAEIDVAERLWKEAKAEYASQLAALRQQIADLDAAMRTQVVARFHGAVERPHTAFDDAMDADDPSEWLNW